MTETEFRALCEAHDLTYDYSDDPRVWGNGTASYDRVRRAAHELGMATAVPIWNAVVDEKMQPDYRQSFYWKV